MRKNSKGKTLNKYALASVKALDGTDPNGEFEVILSAPTLDRDGEVIDSKAFDPLPNHITFDVDHGMSTETTVGSGVPYYEGDLLKVKGTFSSVPLGQTVRTLVTEGHIRTTSVAFMSAERETKDGVPHIIKAELLNGAFVPIPSNREAAIIVAKSFAKSVTEVEAPVTEPDADTEDDSTESPPDQTEAPAEKAAAPTHRESAAVYAAKALAEAATVHI